MNVLVVNCGSSSLKYQLLDMTNETELAKGLFEKIGDQDAIFTHKRPNADKLERVEPILNHKEALRILLDILVDPEFGVIESMDEIDAVGHRVVLDGEKFADSVIDYTCCYASFGRMFVPCSIAQPTKHSRYRSLPSYHAKRTTSCCIRYCIPPNNA